MAATKTNEFLGTGRRKTAVARVRIATGNGKITGIKVGGVDGLVFSAQDISDLHGQTAQDRTVGIDDVPLALIQINFRQMRFHFKFQIKS